MSVLGFWWLLLLLGFFLVLFLNSSPLNSSILNSDFSLKILFPTQSWQGVSLRGSTVGSSASEILLQSCSPDARCSQFFVLFRTALGSSGVPGTSHSLAFKNGCVDNSAVIQTILER